VRVLRVAGLVGSALLAAAAYLVGALPGTDPAVTVRTTGPWEARHLVGITAWLAGSVVLAAAWWRARGTPSLRWALVTGALWAVPLVVAPPLGSRDVYAYACQGALYVDGRSPYQVGVAAGCPWLDAVPVLWHDTPTPYGPLAVLASAAAAASGNLLVAVGLLRAVAVAGILLLIWYGIRLARSLGVEPGPAVWLAALSPVVVVHAVSGAHHDALLAGLTVAALAVAVERRSSAAGVLLGLAVAVKVTGLVVVPFALLLLPRWRDRALAVAAAVAAFALLSAGSGLGVGWVAALRGTGSLVQWTSPPTGLGMAAGYLLRALGWPEAFEEAVAVARLAGLAVLVTVLIWWWLRAWRSAATSPRAVVVAAGAALAALTVLSPVFFPWYALAPLAVLALSTVDPRVRWWLAATGVALTFLVLPYGLGLAVLTKLPGAVLVVVLVAGLAWRLSVPRPRAS